MENFQTVSGLIDILAEGAATCEQLTAVAKELLERKPKIAFDEKAESRIARIIIVVWNGNDCASFETAKGGVLYKAKPITEAVKARAKELQDVLKNYDGGMLIGPASAKTWKLESSWEAGAETIARLMQPPHFHYWRAETFWDSVDKCDDAWHMYDSDYNVQLVSRLLARASDYVYSMLYLRDAISAKTVDGDTVSIFQQKEDLVTLGTFEKAMGLHLRSAKRAGICLAIEALRNARMRVGLGGSA